MGRKLIAYLLAERRAANHRADVATSAAQLVEHGDGSMQALLVAFLDYYAALAQLLGRQPPIRQACHALLLPIIGLCTYIARASMSGIDYNYTCTREFLHACLFLAIK